jgi:hypothetical protein
MTIERDLIKRGTAVGPVTQEMIDRCKAKSPGYEYWADFLPVVREEIEKETGKPLRWEKGYGK